MESEGIGLVLEYARLKSGALLGMRRFSMAGEDVGERYEYDAYGNCSILSPNYEPRETSDYDNPYLFTGRRLDILDNGSLKLQYNRNRYYDQYTGKWLTHDPLEYMGGMNLYEYVVSNPLSALDPLGLLDYKEGDFDPNITHDAGVGPHGVERARWRDHLAKRVWFCVANTAMGIGLDDAGKHMKHYLLNTGDELEIDYEGLIAEVPEAQALRDAEIAEAMAFAETVKNKCSFTISSQAARDGIAQKGVSKNWYYAVRAYKTWGKADVTTDGCGNYKMVFTLKLADRYNWNLGQGVEILGVTVMDADLGRLHTVGIAQEYDMTGEVKYTTTWNKDIGGKGPPPFVPSPPGGPRPPR